MLRSFIDSVSSKILALLILFFVLDYFPITGIFLMMVAGPFIAGFLVLGLLISIFVEAATGRLPRELVLVPILAFCGYYAAYIKEGWQVRQISVALRAVNPGKVYDFDPKVGSLVMERASGFVETHDIPVAYEASSLFPEGYTSVHMVPRAQCNGIKKDSLNRISLFYPKNLCLITVPERPSGVTVKVTSVGDGQPRQFTGMRQQTTEISVDGRIVGSFRTASVRRLPAFPIFAIGCWLNDAASTWDCSAQFLRSPMVIDGIPQGVDGEKFDDPVSVMLGIRKYTDADLKNFSGSTSSVETLARVREEPTKAEDDVFAALDSLIKGQSPQLPSGFNYAIATNPDRLVPLADAMVRRFVALVHSDSHASDWRVQTVSLADAIGALPRAAFANVAASLLDIVKEDPDRALRYFPMIYIRSGETGAAALDFYRAQFMTKTPKGLQEMFPALALCRIGTADADLVQEMKQRYVAANPRAGLGPLGNKEALFVTLLKLGEGAFLRDNHPNNTVQDQWYDSVLAGKGLTEIGPNNCMPKEWHIVMTMAKWLGPSLKIGRNGWDVQGG